MKNLSIYLLTLALGLPGFVMAGDLGELTANCDSCHGPQGASSNSDVPSIGGQSVDYIDDSLRSFQVWGRPCIKSRYRHGDTSLPKTDMCKLAGGLSADEIAALSEHYGALPFVPAQQEYDAEMVAAGASLHETHCEKCHEQGGSSSSSPGPRLAGQWVPYLKSTLQFVPTGEHLVPPMMERELGKFSPEEIDALMNFYASQ